MDQLIATVAEKAGISPEQAKLATQTVMGFIKDKLPAGLASQLDGLMSGGQMPDAGGLLGKLGGMFGGGEEKK
jgi:hypothetical protein